MSRAPGTKTAYTVRTYAESQKLDLTRRPEPPLFYDA